MQKTHDYFKQLLLALSMMALIVACSPVTYIQASTPTPLSASTSTITSLPNITPTLQPTDVHNHDEQNDSFGDGFVARVLIKDANNLSREDILTKLVTLMLDHHQTKSQDPDIAIKDYKDIRVSKVDDRFARSR